MEQLLLGHALGEVLDDQRHPLQEARRKSLSDWTKKQMRSRFCVFKAFEEVAFPVIERVTKVVAVHPDYQRSDGMAGFWLVSFFAPRGRGSSPSVSMCAAIRFCAACGSLPRSP